MTSQAQKNFHATPADEKPWGPANKGAYLVTPHATNLLPIKPLFLRCDVAGVLRMRWVEGAQDTGTITSDVTINVVAGEIINARPDVIHTTTDATIHAFY